MIGPYRVLGRLGAGGMGEVYHAHDERLDRDVALKVVVPREGLPAARALLQHEARAAAGLTHPNIVAIHDVVDHDGRLHVVMEFVDGESLATRIAAGSTGFADVVRIGGDVLAALGHAHARGILHCDLKPGNILIAGDGRAKVVDFGLARIARGAAPSAITRSIASEATEWLRREVIGTPEYMAPELFIGAPPTAQTDLYAAGVVLYQLATGHYPFPHPTLDARVDGSVAQRLAACEPSLPHQFCDLVDRLLSDEPGRRPASAIEAGTMLASLASDPRPEPAPRRRAGARAPLPWLAAFGSAVAVSVWLGLGRHEVAGRSAVPPAVALVPFATSDARNVGAESMAAGLTEFVGADLRSLAGLLVVTPASTNARDPIDELRVGRELGVSTVIAGTVERDAAQVHARIRIVDAAGARVVTEERLDGQYEALAEFVTRVLSTVRRLLRQSGVALAALASAPPQVPPEALFAFSGPAFEEYAQGLAFLEAVGQPGSLDSAIGLLERAVRRLPGLARAHAALGEGYWRKWQATQDAEWAQRAEDAVLEAVRLAPGSPQAHYALAVQYRSRGRRDEALAQVQRSLALRPNSDDAYRLLGRLLSESGRLDEALQAFAAARNLRPGYGENYRVAGIALFEAGRYAEAAAFLTRAAELMPSSASTFQALGTALHASGDLNGALTNYRKAIALAPSGRAWANVGMLHYARGEFADAVSAYERAASLLPRSAVTQRNLGDAYRRYGDLRRARSAYRRAIALCDDMLRINPNDASCYTLQALCWVKAGDPTRAAPLLAHPSIATSADVEVLYQRGVVQVLLGRRTPGIADISTAIARGFLRAFAADDEDLASVKDDPEFAKVVKPQ